MSQGVSLYNYLKQCNQLLEVGVDDDNILLPTSGKRAIGTNGLNGCTCVVILGRSIILSHISPLPGTYQQLATSNRDIPQASHSHHENAISRVTELLRKHADEFPKSSTSWGIFAVSSEGHLKSVEDQVRNHLSLLGYSITAAFYQEIDPQSVNPLKGELVAVLNKSGSAELYLESAKLWPSPESSNQVANTLATSSGRQWPSATESYISGQQRTWMGYSLSGPESHLILSCGIAGERRNVEARWTDGQHYPMIKDPVCDSWSQTVAHGNHLWAMVRGQQVKLEK